MAWARSCACPSTPNLVAGNEREMIEDLVPAAVNQALG